MSLYRVALAALLLALLGRPDVLAQAPGTPEPALLTLEALLAEVEAANPTLRAARLDAEAAALVGAQVSALPEPTVSIMAAPYPAVAEGSLMGARVSVEQMLPWPGTLTLRREAAGYGAAVAAAQATALALDLVFQVRKAYYELYEAQQVRLLVERYQARLASFSEATAVSYEVGRGPQGAILQVQLEADRLGTMLLDLRTREERARQTLARLSNRPGLVRAQAVTLDAPPVPDPEGDLVARALELRPELEALEAAREQMATEVALAEKAFYPDLGLSVAYNDMPGATGVPNQVMVGAMVRVPLWRGALNARLEEARLRERQVEARREALETEIVTELADLLVAARQEAETLALFRDRLIPRAGTTVEAMLTAYTTGQEGYLALLDAERMRFDLQTSAEAARTRYLTTIALIERAAGLYAPPTAEGALLTLGAN